MSLSVGLSLAERGLVPTALIRSGIRRLLRQRLRDLHQAGSQDEFLADLARSPIALNPDRANEQHYEVPPEFFSLVLGPHLKYSSGYWPHGTRGLVDAETRMLKLTCERASLLDGQDVLELGCGWGSLSLYMARRYPNSRILAVSNSAPQRKFIESRAPVNLEVVTADMNDFRTDRVFDRVVSVEMFEHMRNYQELLARISRWLRPEGRLFVHIFCHRDHSYAFETEGVGNWMGRHFFTGGLMPSFGLLPRFDRDLCAQRLWVVNGTHYQRTAAAWRVNLERNQDAVLDVFSSTYGSDADRWYHRWRVFFLACEELFGFRGGEEWFVGHYLFVPRSTTTQRGDARLTARADATWRAPAANHDLKVRRGAQ